MRLKSAYPKHYPPVNKLILKFIPYITLITSAYLQADTLEDVTCYLSDAVPKCIASTNNTDHINVVLKPQYTVVKVEPVHQTINPTLLTQSSSQWTVKDTVSAVLATIGIAGFILNFYNLILSNQNRRNDQFSERFHFWLKEIIYPQHIKPLITKLTDIARDYNHWVSLTDYDEKILMRDRFMELWPEEKLALLNSLPNEGSLPYLNEVFSSAKANILQLDEFLLSAFLTDDIVDIPGNEDLTSTDFEIKTDTIDYVETEAPKGRDLLDKIIQDIYTGIYEAQKNPIISCRIKTDHQS
ncbi:hypothetical protein AL543_09130 [Vibrio mimicus]|nr:hypothetical protein AL543_09130 [Vibrio mimicus]KAA3493589.1 hypothetical protein Y058_02930 [Vibrio mimicus]